MIRSGWLLASLAWAALLCFPALWLGAEGHLWGLVAEARFNGFSWALIAGLLEMTVLAALPYGVLGVLCRMFSIVVSAIGVGVISLLYVVFSAV